MKMTLQEIMDTEQFCIKVGYNEWAVSMGAAT